MATEEVYQRVLEHLKKEGPLNTFRLATNLDIDRSKLLNFIEKLEKVGAVEVQCGLVRFLKFAVEEKRTESKVKESEQKAKAPKIIRRTIVQKVPVIKKVYVKSKKLEEQAEQIAKLEKTIKELEKKARAPPKIITKTVTRTIVKKVPVTKTIVRKIPVLGPPSGMKVGENLKARFKKIKFPKFSFIENIKKLKKPEFIK